MSTNSIVQAALTNTWLDQQGVPNLQATWIAYHYPSQTTPSTAVSAIALATVELVRSVVWGPEANYLRLPD